GISRGEAVAGYTGNRRRALGRGVESESDVLIAAKRVTVGHMHDTLEHVAGTVRTPQVSDAVVAGGDRDAGLVGLFHWYDWEIVDRGGDQGDAGIGEGVQELVLPGRGGLAESIGVADGDLAGQAGGPG